MEEKEVPEQRNQQKLIDELISDREKFGGTNVPEINIQMVDESQKIKVKESTLWSTWALLLFLAVDITLRVIEAF